MPGPGSRRHRASTALWWNKSFGYEKALATTKGTPEEPKPFIRRVRY